MAQCRSAVYKVLVVLVAAYGVVSACICADHATMAAAMTACHHCAGSGADAAGTQIASHHQCCGLERAPLAVERVASSDPEVSVGRVLSSSVAVLPCPDLQAVAISSPSHAPPGDIPIFLATQRFLI